MKREFLLSKLERDRLFTRNELTNRLRTTNETRVRKKLNAWLKNTFDALTILDNLPEDQVKKVADPYDAYILCLALKRLLNKTGFHPIEGDVHKPEEWCVLMDDKTRRHAEDVDLFKASLLELVVDDLSSLRGEQTVIAKVMSLGKAYNDPYLKDRITEDEKRAIERLNHVWDEFFKGNTKYR